SGYAQDVPRWKQCLRATDSVMPFAFLSLYHESFAKRQDISVLRSSLSLLRHQMFVTVEDTKIFSSIDTPMIRDRLKKTTWIELYPGWLMSEEEQNVFYEAVRDIPTGNVLRAVLKAREAHMTDQFMQLLH